ncbi:class I SAM-dependent methyltransferase [Desulfonema ishimotonii]|uniref:Class I SAM-dependent methyltransferase n=1 Tax=Desulfonema ishimotonii TaxID=45657 RepID=A0A401FW65_9BACT|nr:methyltransferase domain-containing protein [Desulfonema ishimotonii]GBC61208.1 class I SAM-dependent methyltransferase [Desulfonema ishimotonii]
MADISVEKREAFSRKMVDILNSGAVNLAMAIGYRTRLFDVMETFDAPRTVSAIAGKAGLSERYVREWLGVMCTAGVVELTGENGKSRYFLPGEHAAFLTRNAGNNNLGVYTQEIPLLTRCAMEPVVDGFRTGNGVPYSHYPSFQSFMTELGNAKHRRVLVDNFLPSVGGGEIVARLKTGIRVCDLGCGEGVALLLMAEAFPESRFTGIDLDEKALDMAREAAADEGLENIELLTRDAALLETDTGLSGAFDYITAFDAIHDQTAPLAALRGVRHMLAKGGVFSMIDIASETGHAENMDHPMAPFLYTVSLMHCMAVGLVNGGTGLGMMWGREKAVEMLAEAGFDAVDVIEMADDPFNLHYFCRK